MIGFYNWFLPAQQIIFVSEMMRLTVLLIGLLFTLACGGKIPAEQEEAVGGEGGKSKNLF